MYSVSLFNFPIRSPDRSPTGWKMVGILGAPQNAKSLLSYDLQAFCWFLYLIGGEWGIRTRGPCYKSTVFKTAAIDHSANSPRQKYKYTLILQIMMLIF